MSLSYFLLLLVNVGLGVLGQTLLKIGVSKIGGFSFANFSSFFISSFTNPLIILGNLLYALSAVLWLVLLSKVDLSMAYPMLSLGYVIILFVSSFILHEPVHWINVVGVLMIFGGVILVTRRI